LCKTVGKTANARRNAAAQVFKVNESLPFAEFHCDIYVTVDD